MTFGYCSKHGLLRIIYFLVRSREKVYFRKKLEMPYTRKCSFRVTVHAGLFNNVTDYNINRIQGRRMNSVQVMFHLWEHQSNLGISHLTNVTFVFSKTIISLLCSVDFLIFSEVLNFSRGEFDIDPSRSRVNLRRNDYIPIPYLPPIRETHIIIDSKCHTCELFHTFISDFVSYQHIRLLQQLLI